MRVEKVNFIPPIKLYTSEYNRNFPQEKVFFFSEKMSDKKKERKNKKPRKCKREKGGSTEAVFSAFFVLFFLPRAYIFSPSIIFKIRR